MSARQYPRQPAISSHIYSMHSSFSVLCSSLSSSQVMSICVCVSLNESCYTSAVHVFLPKSVCFYGFFLFCCCYGEVTESYIGYTIYRMCLCVYVWMHGFVLVCVDLAACAHLCAFSSDATRGSLKLMGPPVASLLIFLHPSPLGRVLAARPGPPRDLRASHAALPLLAVLLVVLRRLATQQAQIWLTFLGVLAPCWPLHRRSSGLQPRPALRRTGLLPLGVGSQSFRPYRRVGTAGGVRFTLTVAVGCLHPLLFALFLPNSVAKLLHAVEVWVVQERQEVSIPQPVLGRVTRPARCAGKSGQDVTQSLGGDDLEVEAHERLDEAVFDSLAVVDTCVRLGQTADEQALVCTQHPVIELDLNKDTERKTKR